MKIAKQQVENELTRYINVESVEQVDSKQLFVVKVKDKPVKLLVSYYTVIGFSVPNMFNGYHVTDRRYSVTTARQLSHVRRETRAITTAHSDFIPMLAGVLNITPGQASHLTSM
jgi:hypothetical protein